MKNKYTKLYEELFKIGSDKDKIQFLENLYKQEEESLFKEYVKGRILYFQKDYDKTLSHLLNLNEQDKDNTFINYDLGNNYYELKKNKDAEQ